VRNCGCSCIVKLGCQKSCPLGHLQQHNLRLLLFSDTIEQLLVAHSSSRGIDATADAPVSHSCAGNFATSEPDRTCMLQSSSVAHHLMKYAIGFSEQDEILRAM